MPGLPAVDRDATAQDRSVEVPERGRVTPTTDPTDPVQARILRLEVQAPMLRLTAAVIDRTAEVRDVTVLGVGTDSGRGDRPRGRAGDRGVRLPVRGAGRGGTERAQAVTAAHLERPADQGNRAEV